MIEGTAVPRDGNTVYSPPEFSANHQVGGRRNGFSLIAATVTLLRHWRKLVVLPAIAGAVTIAVSLRSTPTYTSGASFIPKQADASALSNLSGLAAQFGVNVPQGDESQSPAFFADLVTSRGILERVADTTYSLHSGEGHGATDLATIFEVHEATPARTREKTIRTIRQQMKSDVDPKSGVVYFSVSTPSAQLSAEVAQRVLDLITEFSRRNRQDQARAQHLFMQGRLDSAAAELHRAEREMQAFMLRNRSFAGDPQASVEHDRISLEIQLQQQLYMSLAQGVEQARLDAARSPTVLTVVEPPEPPVIADRRYIALKAIAASFAVLLALAGVLVSRESLLASRETAADFEELVGVLREMRGNVARVRGRRSGARAT